MGKTRVIAIEGIDGSGKSVQFGLLREALTARDLSVATKEFPRYDSFFGAEIGKFLTGADGIPADRVDGKSMALWFALDRFDSFRDYRDGEADVLLINRYVLSNAVYQSIRDIDLGKKDLFEWSFELECGYLGLPRPDISIFYDVDRAQAGENVLRKGHRAYVGDGADIYERSASIQDRARAKYLEYAARTGDIAVIACMEGGVFLSKERIHEKTMTLLEGLGLTGPQ